MLVGGDFFFNADDGRLICDAINQRWLEIQYHNHVNKYELTSHINVYL